MGNKMTEKKLPQSTLNENQKLVIKELTEKLTATFEKRNYHSSLYGYPKNTNRNYKGVRSSIHNENFRISKDTADQELLNGELDEIRVANRQLVKDSGIAEGTLITMVNMTIGKGPEIEIPNARAQKVWDAWQANCDITGEKSFTKILKEVVGQSCMNGDLLLITPLDPSIKPNQVQTRVDLVEADRIQTPGGMTNDTIRLGVRYDSFGHVVGYYVSNLPVSETEHRYTGWASSIKDFTYYPKVKNDRLSAWLFKRSEAIERPNSSRGLPLFTSVLKDFIDIESFFEANIVGARVAACMMAVIESSNPEEILTALSTDPADGASLTDKYGQPYSKLQPATIIPLKPGEKANMLNPAGHFDAADPLILRKLKILSMKMRIPYPILFLDLSEINYSSYRGGILETKKMIESGRSDIEEKIITRVVQAVMYEAWLKGILPNANLSEALFTPIVHWPKWGYTDPEKEYAANKIAIDNGLSSHNRICAENGDDWQAIMEEEAAFYAKRKALEKQYDIKFPEDKTAAQLTAKEPDKTQKPKPKEAADATENQ